MNPPCVPRLAFAVRAAMVSPVAWTDPSLAIRHGVLA
jgi:hypothetical protein